MHNQVLGEDQHSSLQMAIFRLCLHIVEEAREFCGVFFYKGANPIHENFTLHELITSQGPVS